LNLQKDKDGQTKEHFGMWYKQRLEDLVQAEMYQEKDPAFFEAQRFTPPGGVTQ